MALNFADGTPLPKKPARSLISILLIHSIYIACPVVSPPPGRWGLGAVVVVVDRLGTVTLVLDGLDPALAVRAVLAGAVVAAHASPPRNHSGRYKLANCIASAARSPNIAATISGGNESSLIRNLI
ncbi:hypothetical protein Henu3_gp30 [Mycobacterium phage Henu3]|uniref:Uncharacterized protein n=1 Tax=Mycobacterium phage Henu3 TaxID=2492961 RepID=A0A410T7L2_9CAUD|nr:hypothetical protein I5G68_gp27 [Mycobacterium phage Henu3]QAU04974.1 hypothetical protein Henu3_gp30 [Mycobacterium phage Henu3]